jgi:hypothetical protein
VEIVIVFHSDKSQTREVLTDVNFCYSFRLKKRIKSLLYVDILFVKYLI